jgi:hypothetical protein
MYAQQGLVIGTFAAVPYVHLQLEAWRRYYPDIPVLVHDDGSLQAPRLAALADEYGASFISTLQRRRHYLGDLSVYPAAFSWCRAREIRYLLKVSRRWLWLIDWRDDLRKLFTKTEAPTASNYTISYAFGFRTECVAFDTGYWACPGFFNDVQDRLTQDAPIFVEDYIHSWARRLSLEGTQKWQRWLLAHPVQRDRQGYAAWDLMGTCRHIRSPDRYWHNSHSSKEYAALAREWGLIYDFEEFNDPNAGEGFGEIRRP